MCIFGQIYPQASNNLIRFSWPQFNIPYYHIVFTDRIEHLILEHFVNAEDHIISASSLFLNDADIVFVLDHT